VAGREGVNIVVDSGASSQFMSEASHRVILTIDGKKIGDEVRLANGCISQAPTSVSFSIPWDPFSRDSSISLNKPGCF
jgi:hypothetical protein